MPFVPTRRWIAPLVALAAVTAVGLLPASSADAVTAPQASTTTAVPAVTGTVLIRAGQSVPLAALYPPNSYCGRGDIQHWDYYHYAGYTQGGACQASPDNGHFAQFQSDGNFVVYTAKTSTNRATWASMTNGRGRFLNFWYDGEVWIGDANHNHVWSNFVHQNQSQNYLFTLVMQNDGNLVEYVQPRSGGALTALWSTRTAGH